MYKGQTLYDDDGNQVMLFPLDVMNITQWHGSGTYSHYCGCEFDTVGTTTQYPVYAPCDCHVIYKYDTYASGYTRLYTNDKKVVTPNGVYDVGTVVFGFTHRDSVLDQESFKQGEHIYNTGTSGSAQGDHVHIDQSFTANAQLVPCSVSGMSWYINGSVEPYLFWYVNDTDIKNDWGQDWKTFEGGSPTPTPEYEYIKHYFIMDGLGIDIGFYTEKREKPQPTPTPTYEWFIPEESRHLTEDESKQNWLAVWGYFKNKGWTAQSVSGMLGNMYYESSVNPNRWESDTPYISGGGFGLVQWTPYSNIVNWITNLGHWGQVQYYGDDECAKIQNEMETGGQWIATTSYPESFQQFSVSTASPYNLALEFLANYERPYDPNQPQRGTKALEIYEYIKDK